MRYVAGYFIALLAAFVIAQGVWLIADAKAGQREWYTHKFEVGPRDCYVWIGPRFGVVTSFGTLGCWVREE